MTIQTQYTYPSGTGFVYDSTKVQFDGTSASLALVNNPGQLYTPNVAAATFDATLMEVVGGVLRLKDQRPATATFYAALTSSINGNWGGGSLTVTPSNSAAIVSGMLDLTGSTNKYVTIPAVGNTQSPQTGTIEFQWKPNYSGTPGADQALCCVYNTTNSLVNLLLVVHKTDGHLLLQVGGAAGSFDGSVIGSPVSIVAGTTYTVTVQFDFTAGIQNILLNGSSIGTGTVHSTRSTAVTACTLGTDYTLGNNADFSIGNFAYYSTVVTPSSPTLSATIYPAATATLPPASYSGLGHVQAFTAASATDMGAPTYVVNGKYWTGSAWATSNNTAGQSSSAATIIANVATLPATDSQSLVGYFSAGSVQESLTAIQLTYSGQLYSQTNPTIAPNTPITLDAITALTAVLAASGSDGVQFYLLIGSVPYYYTGSAWAVSNLSYAQTNTAAVINAQAATAPVTQGVYVTPYAMLHSANGSTTPSLTSLTVTYDLFGVEPGTPAVCTVFGYIIDDTGTPVVGAIVSATAATSFVNAGIFVAQGVVTATTNALGYFRFVLTETTTPNVKLAFSVKYPGTRGSYSYGSTLVPNTPLVNLATLTFS